MKRCVTITLIVAIHVGVVAGTIWFCHRLGQEMDLRHHQMYHFVDRVGDGSSKRVPLRFPNCSFCR